MIQLRAVLLRAVLALAAAYPWSAGVGPAFADSAATPVIAIVDVQRVLAKSKAVKSLTDQIEARRGAYQAQLRKSEEALRKEGQELSRQRSVLSAEAFAKKRAALEQKAGELQREARKGKRRFDSLFNQGMTKVQNALAKVSAEIAQERGIDLVLSKIGVVIVKPKFEITDEILKRLNSKITDAKLPPAQK
jgi:Skp family chaperone for outer membrane proteins